MLASSDLSLLQGTKALFSKRFVMNDIIRLMCQSYQFGLNLNQDPSKLHPQSNPTAQVWCWILVRFSKLIGLEVIYTE